MEEPHNKNLESSTIELRSYLDIILKRKKIFAVCFIVPVIIITVFSFVRKPIYRAMARIDVGTGFKMPLKELFQEARHIQTQIEILEGDKQKERILENLITWRKNIPEKYLEPDVKVKGIRTTTMIDIWIDSPYPDYAKAYTEAMMDEYLLLKKQHREESSQSALINLSKEVNIINEKLKLAQAQLQNFKKENEEIIIEDYGNLSLDYLTSLAVRISELETKKRLIKAKIEAIESSDNPSFWISVINENQLRAASAGIREESYSISPKGLEDELIVGDNDNFSNNVLVKTTPPIFISLLEEDQLKRWKELKNKYMNLKAKLAGMEKIYKPKHPQRVKAENELEAVEKGMRLEVRNILEAFKQEQEGVDLEIATLKTNVKEWQGVALASSSKIAQLRALEEEVLRLRKLYDVLIRRGNEIEVSVDSGLENVMVIEDAKVLSKPIKPKRARDILLSIIAGLALGGGLVFFLDYIDDTIKSGDDLKKYTGLVDFGTVYSIDWDNDNLPSHKITLLEQNPVIEAYRSIRTNIIMSAPETKMKTILITSSFPEEGKTTTALNVAISLAQGDSRVLLVDGDLRRPSLHQFFSCDNGKGFSSILVGKDIFENCVKLTEVGKLDLLTAGETVPDPPKLFHRARMKEFLSYIGTMYDRIIIDSPPILSVTDTVGLSDWADGIIIVIRGANTSCSAVIEAMGLLRNNSAKIIGGVINNLPFECCDHYYKYKKYYKKHNYNPYQPVSV